MRQKARTQNLDFPLWPKQEQAFYTEANEVLYGGSAGPGKSHFLRVSAVTWAAMVSGLQVYLFRRTFPELMATHMEGPTGFPALLANLIKAGACKITDKRDIRFANGPNGFLDGSAIHLRHCQYESDVFGYQGPEFHVLLLDEATQFTEFMIRFLRARCRIPKALPIPEGAESMFPRIVYASNPGGVGHTYFKRHFVKAEEPMKIWQASKSEGGKLRQFIPALVEDNPSIDPEEYKKTLEGLPETWRDALLKGDWDAIIGAFFDVLLAEKHQVPDVYVPDHLYKYRSFDWGSAAPFAVSWWFISDGKPMKTIPTVLIPSSEIVFPRGARVCYREWYGCSDLDWSKGLGLSNEEMADGIRTRSPERNIQGTVTDSLPFQDRGGKKISAIFAERGVPLTLGDTSREKGWARIRDLLKGENDQPMMYFTESCFHTFRCLQNLQTHPKKPEEIADNQEDHAPDAVRLAATAKPGLRDEPPKPEEIKPPVITKQWVMQQMRRTKDAVY